MIYPCPAEINCPGSDFPIENYSSEDPEVARFCAIGQYANNGPLDCPVFASATVKACSPVSYADALLAANQQARAIVVAQQVAGNCPAPTFCNAEQTCDATCPDGTKNSYTVPAGVICAESQEAADAQAYSYACQQARDRSICLSDLPSFCCLDTTYNGIITASGNGLSIPPVANFWEIFGLLPTGLTFHGGYIVGTQAFITGVPTDAIPETFVIKVTAQNGLSAVKTYTLGATSIDWTGATPAFAPLPPGFVGTPYVLDIIFPVALPSPAIWAVSGGALPPGLALNPVTGLLSGTPLAAGTYNFTLSLFSA